MARTPRTPEQERNYRATMADSHARAENVRRVARGLPELLLPSEMARQTAERLAAEQRQQSHEIAKIREENESKERIAAEQRSIERQKIWVTAIVTAIVSFAASGAATALVQYLLK